MRQNSRDEAVRVTIPTPDGEFDVVRSLGVRSVRLLTNNPAKVEGLRAHGIEVREMVALPTAPNTRNLRYLRTKQERFGHLAPTGPELNGTIRPAIDATSLLG